MRLRGVWAALLALVVCLAAAVAACGSDGNGNNGFPNPSDPDGSVLGDPDASFDLDGSVDTRVLEISPLDQVVALVTGQPTPTIQYVAKLGGQQVPAIFSVDRGEIGSVSTTGLFSPSGNVGGKAFVTATYAGKTAKTSVTVQIKVIQNGDPNAGDAGAGAGGNGGVGGEGPGAAVSGATQTALLGTPVADPGLTFLYPYDKTVWPRGILAPLLQWKPGARGDYDAVYIHLKENNFEYQGFFAKTASPFQHHPVPQSVWKQLAYSNAGEDVTVSVVLSVGGTAYGPLSETWKIAQGTLKGVVYYNSYGTALAQNYCCHLGTALQFGGATLAIKGGSTDPVLVAGGNGGGNCRVCHSVAANGSALVTQHDNNSISSHYDLKNGNAETPMTPQDGRFAWGAIYPDATFMFSNAAPLQGASALPSALYALPTGAAVAANNLPAGLRAGTPVFSPDGAHVAFNFWAGTGADAKSLAMMDFTNATKNFSNLQVLHTPAGTNKAWWPSFLPTNDAVVFEVETRWNNRDYAATRSDCDGSGGCNDVGTRAELWWLDLKTKTPHRLDNLNGAGYLPVGPNAHDDDATLNYEPTVNPVPSGGYAWVVFTSRRLYGNVATINPFWSDPRFQNIRTTPTTKKLWVAAIDLNASPGTDPSHPAFYLPAQELLAGNSRGYWVVDPCKQDGNTCETGDECCGGFCRPSGDGGLVCTAQTPGCAQEFEKCTTNADCCNGPTFQCVNGRCAQSIPR
jgi:hypothetical protein